MTRQPQPIHQLTGTGARPVAAHSVAQSLSTGRPTDVPGTHATAGTGDPLAARAPGKAASFTTGLGWDQVPVHALAGAAQTISSNKFTYRTSGVTRPDQGGGAGGIIPSWHRPEPKAQENRISALARRQQRKGGFRE